MSLIWCFTDSVISCLLFKFLNKHDLLTCRSINWEMWENIPLIKILPGTILHQSKSITCWLSKEENAAAKVLTTWYGRLHKRQFLQMLKGVKSELWYRGSIVSDAHSKFKNGLRHGFSQHIKEYRPTWFRPNYASITASCSNYNKGRRTHYVWHRNETTFFGTKFSNGSLKPSYPAKRNTKKWRQKIQDDLNF